VHFEKSPSMSMPQKLPARNFTVFISTGRCGTQFFAENLTAFYRDLLVAEHEPLEQEYAPRANFSAYHRGQAALVGRSAEKHFEDIENTLANRPYVEVGWPVYGLTPYLLTRFHNRIRVVHLYRHPLRVAASLATHRVYSRGDWTEAMSITPSDIGVVQSSLAGEAWSRLSKFEKCLFWWVEINHFALRLRESFATVPWLSLRFEDVFSEQGGRHLMQLAQFLDVPIRESFLACRQRKTDRYVRTVPDFFDGSMIDRYPEALELAGRLGYTASDVSGKQLQERYNLPQWKVWVARGRRIARKLIGRH
jgi:hypothetical protein